MEFVVKCYLKAHIGEQLVESEKYESKSEQVTKDQDVPIDQSMLYSVLKYVQH